LIELHSVPPARAASKDQSGGNGTILQPNSRWHSRAMRKWGTIEMPTMRCGLTRDVARSKGRICPTRAMQCHLS
jgi:hypothetical protein